MKTLYLNYGITLAALGLLGYFLTHAKSALLSGLISGIVLVILALLIKKPFVAIIAKVINILLLAVFSWRSSLAITALLNQHPEKTVPAILLLSMAIVSLVVLFKSFRAKA